ncbi:zinc finger and BTB domain-containing protein 46 isoform X1 [Denticeps clupeoides]|uniref:zinc finger and BTB domain-containing protein 46 isoform X1 n=1 Tax=Denticeps clupeoides TaxID=299321 RepID=UPI0010A3A4BE|nr:zinc finger and BTB domain-containing protein 46 isoform X1 [Denticeps clupeoides]XP_028850462.1 zinc finger and BTB domain-containing protein 46 isoform X1 [Denticeps clupeoides]XP_028850463.1 zinc finger and BTB domain-containing protein 46 isoform X1 [Denticeps clupeoides]XP_028850465.1 zinc finger and BTB domain-containing protein 46 isoform X1 [Denticeps clupeoides]XP_028850466.1 zinc finger and BTB domain-containing protein 46 isoform X1 [Denticeps clupeoides]
MNNRKEDMEITSHYRQLLRELNEQRQHGILCDVCVIVEGKIFKAHKNVLLGSSRYFKTLYCQVKKGTEQQATITHLDIVTAQGFKTILDFMYSAHLALTSKNVIEVMSAASYLQMTDIVQACHGFIKAALDISIRSELADELADFEMGTVATSAGGAIGGISGGASEALASMISGRSSSPWLARRTSPANSSGDSAIASCHEGGSNYGKEDQEPKSHESQDDVCSQPLWPADYRSVQVKEEQVSPSNLQDGSSRGPQGPGGEQGHGGEGGWTPSGSGRRKNRKNKDTVRHITQQAEGDSRAASPVPSMLSASAWNFNNQDIPGVDVTEPNSSDSRSERLDFFVKQEEALAGDGVFLGPALSSERDEAGGQAHGQGGSVANLRAALMSKNSLLSLRAEMLGEDNPLLFDYLPKGGPHSLSRLGFASNSSSNHPGGKFASKQGASSPPPPPPHPPLPPPPPRTTLPAPPPTPLRPAEPRAPEGPGLGLGPAWAAGPVENADLEEAQEPSPLEEEMLEEEETYSNSKGLEYVQLPRVQDQMAEGQRGACMAKVRSSGSAWPRELACSLCKQLFGSLVQLRQHEYGHTLSLMALSLDCLDHRQQLQQQQQQRPLAATPPEVAARYLCSQCPASFTLKSNADRHEKTIHFKRKLMQCAYCLKHFRDRTDLNRHLSSVHSSERVYACPGCGRTFSTQKNLATHAKVCCRATTPTPVPTQLLWGLQALKCSPHSSLSHSPSGD